LHIIVKMMIAPCIGKTRLSNIRNDYQHSIFSSQKSSDFHLRRTAGEHSVRGREIHEQELSLKEKYNSVHRPLNFRNSFGGARWSTSLSFYNKPTSFKRSYASANLPPHTPVGLPALSPTMEKGNIAKWRKKEGDKIKPGDVIAEVETDKATVDFECTEEGYLAKILYPEGTKDLNVNEVIAIMVENQADVAAFKDYKPEGKAGDKPAAAESKPQPPQPQQPQAPRAQAPPPPTQQPPQPSARVVPGAPPPPSQALPKSMFVE